MKQLITPVLALFAFNVQAVTVELSADKDNTLYETANGDLSNGSGDYFFVGRSNQNVGFSIKRGLLHFDISSIPQGSSITDVTLEVTSNPGNGATTITLHKVTTDWGEGTSDAPGQEGGGAAATSGDATWTMNFFNSSSWSNVGGDFESSPLATAQVPSNPGTFAISSEGLTAQVQSWVNNSANNFGFILLGDETTSETATQFSSRENSSGQPKLIIDYLPPIQAQVQLEPSKDNTLFETDTGSTSNGAGDRLFIGKTGGSAQFKLRRAVMEFDLSSIHPEATMGSSSLQVNTTNAAPGGVGFTANLQLLLSEWGEGTSNGSGSGASATTGDATWLHTFHDTSTWNNAGGDFSNTVSSSASFGTSFNEVVTFNSTTDMVADLQLWLDNDTMNHGWVILGDELTNQNARGISSREGNNPPILTINYSLPDLIFEDGFE
jgi:hypothetical protein